MYNKKTHFECAFHLVPDITKDLPPVLDIPLNGTP